VAALLALVIAGCSSQGHAHRAAASSPAPGALRHVTLILDFVPNAVHAGIYRALGAGYYRRAGIALSIVQPSSTSDTLRLIDSGRADFGLADGIDVAGLVAAGGDAQAILAITQRPLGGVIALASEHLDSPATLQGRAVGVTGVPSDLAVLDTEVRHAGGKPGRVRTVNVGFNGAAAVVAGRLAAFTGFGAADAVALQVAGHPTSVFALDRNGGPSYPGLQLFSTRRRLAADPALARGFVAATVRGYQDTLAAPARGLDALLALNPGLPRPLTRASLRAYLPLFSAAGVRFGTLAPRALAALSAWMVANHLLRTPIAPSRLATDAYLPGSGRR
jgi:putative hydroxymethylpyrimidine transport system substrate-binding protein